MPWPMDNRIVKVESKCKDGDLVELKAWWKDDALTECKVVSVFYSERTNEQFVTVRPTAGNPHQRFVNQNRITKVNGIDVENAT